MDRMFAQIRIRLAHRRQMPLDLPLHMTSEAKLVLLVRKILDVDAISPRPPQRMLAATIIWFGRSIRG